MKRFICLFLTTLSLYAAPKAVIFDFGGVIATSVRSTAHARLKELFHLSNEECSQLRKNQKAFMQNIGTEIEFWEDLAKTKNIILPPNWIDEWYDIITKSIVVNPEILSLIEDLKANHIQVGLLSNIYTEYAVLLRRLGYYDSFDPCILSCDVSLRKPDHKIYKILLDKLSLSPQDVIFIDDKEENVLAAKQLGIDAILFKNAKELKNFLIEKKAL